MPCSLLKPQHRCVLQVSIVNCQSYELDEAAAETDAAALSWPVSAAALHSPGVEPLPAVESAGGINHSVESPANLQLPASSEPTGEECDLQGSACKAEPSAGLPSHSSMMVTTSGGIDTSAAESQVMMDPASLSAYCKQTELLSSNKAAGRVTAMGPIGCQQCLSDRGGSKQQPLVTAPCAGVNQQYVAVQQQPAVMPKLLTESDEEFLDEFLHGGLL